MCVVYLCYRVCISVWCICVTLCVCVCVVSESLCVIFVSLCVCLCVVYLCHCVCVSESQHKSACLSVTVCVRVSGYVYTAKAVHGRAHLSLLGVGHTGYVHTAVKDLRPESQSPGQLTRARAVGLNIAV